MRFAPRAPSLLAILDGLKAKVRGRGARNTPVLTQVPLILWTTDTDFRITSALGAGLNGLGDTPAKLVGLHIRDWLGGDDTGAATIAAHSRALAGEVSSCEQTWRGRVFQVTVEPLRNGHGDTVDGAIGVALDITQRRRMEGELARLQAIVESSDDAIVATRLDGIITAWNAGAERLYGWTAVEAVGRSIAIVTTPDRPGELPAILSRIARGERLDRHEAIRVRKDGTRIEVSLSVSPIRDGSGRIIGTSAIARDVGSRRRAERAEQQTEALRAVASLAVATAHDVNNPLAVVAGQLHLLARRTEDPTVRHRIGMALEAADRIRDVVARLARFSRARIAGRDLQRPSEDPEHPRVA